MSDWVTLRSRPAAPEPLECREPDEVAEGACPHTAQAARAFGGHSGSEGRRRATVSDGVLAEEGPPLAPDF